MPAWAGGRRTHRPFGELRLVTWGALAVLAAAGVGYGLSTEKPFLAFSVALFPLVLWLWVHPTVPLVLLGASIPFVQSLGGAGGSYSVALSDLLLVLIGSGIAVGAVISKSATSFAALRPVGLLVLQFAVVIVLLLPFHFGLAEVAQTAQRLELFLLPLLVGAFAALHGKHIPLLQGYVVSTTVLAVVWQFNSLGMQKNPVGQFIANAILVLVALPALRRLLPCVFVLIPALFLTESRGAVIAAAIGTVVIVFFHEARLRTALTRGRPTRCRGRRCICAHAGQRPGASDDAKRRNELAGGLRALDPPGVLGRCAADHLRPSVDRHRHRKLSLRRSRARHSD